MKKFKSYENGISPRAVADDREWSARCVIWCDQANSTRHLRLGKRQMSEPLILAGHGVRIRVDHGTLLVQNGFTHYPQEREERRFFPGDWRAPSRIVLLDCDGGLSFDALAWLSDQRIPLVQINWQGDVLTVAGWGGRAIETNLVNAQRAAQRNGMGLEFARKLIARKIENSIETLRIGLPSSPAVTTALRNLEQRADEIERLRPRAIGAVHGIEGHAAGVYFVAWHAFPMRWKGIGRHPIPDDWKRISTRQSMVATNRQRNRHATHPVNAMLNYGYGILRSHVHQHVVAAGFDPSVGYLHTNYRDKPALVYDLMEPLRPIVDRGVLEFVQRHVFEPADFMLTSEGVCRLNPQLARSIVKFADADFRAAETAVDLIRLLRK